MIKKYTAAELIKKFNIKPSYWNMFKSRYGLKDFEIKEDNKIYYTEQAYLKLEEIYKKKYYCRIETMMFVNSGNNTKTTRISIPIGWARQLGFSEQDRKAKVLFKKDKIIIEKDNKK